MCFSARRSHEPEKADIGIMPDLFQLALFGLTVLMITGCVSKAPINPEDMTLCSKPRPQVCAMIYDPVCGYVETGESSSFASACNACSDIDVIGHTPGAC